MDSVPCLSRLTKCITKTNHLDNASKQYLYKYDIHVECVSVLLLSTSSPSLHHGEELAEGVMVVRGEGRAIVGGQIVLMVQ